jgi:hypothetical protein
MREAKKVESLRFALSSAFPVLFGIPPELDQARLVWMKFQPKFSQPCLEILQKTIRVSLMIFQPGFILLPRYAIYTGCSFASRSESLPGVGQRTRDGVKR